MIWFLIVLLLLGMIVTSGGMVDWRREWQRLSQCERQEVVLGLLLAIRMPLGAWVTWHWYNILGLAVALTNNMGA